LDSKGFKVEKGTIQDAAFIEADLGKKRYRKVSITVEFSPLLTIEKCATFL
jgi:hypothetical protein